MFEIFIDFIKTNERIVYGGYAQHLLVNDKNPSDGLYHKDLIELDIGIYPLTNDDWILGKSGLKAMQYMAIGIPAVSTAVGNVLNIIEDEVDGILVYEENEWKQKLKILLDDEMKRNIIGKNARNYALNQLDIKSKWRLSLVTFI